jgi:prepilin-type N-terminal cleavage/methylation domain-containing protein
MQLKARRGFSLIELIFAIFILSVGALGLAATSALVIKSIAEAAARERGARVASSRLETLHSLGCGQAQSGSEITQGIQSAWTVTISGQVVSAVATVSYVLGGRTRTDTYSSLFSCSQ